MIKEVVTKFIKYHGYYAHTGDRQQGQSERNRDKENKTKQKHNLLKHRGLYHPSNLSTESKNIKYLMHSPFPLNL